MGGIKVQAVANLSNDIALAMKAMSVRVVAPIPGKSAVGIELPNVDRAIVRLREVLTNLVAHLEALREGTGPGVDILLDLNFNAKTEGYLKILRAIAHLDQNRPEGAAR